MDLSRVPKTDFSIDRILSEECGPSGNINLRHDHPWLRCTRYKPPRVTRASSRRRRAGSHARIPFTAEQSLALEDAFTRAHYLAPPALSALARGLTLREDRIKIWFQNRRARERKEKGGSVQQPKPATLPSNMDAMQRFRVELEASRAGELPYSIDKVTRVHGESTKATEQHTDLKKDQSIWTNDIHKMYNYSESDDEDIDVDT